MRNIIEMAKEAGITVYNNEIRSVECETEHLERFSDAVREECAKTCEELGAEGYGTLYIAAAIRGSK